MKQSPLLQFESSFFRVSPGEDEETNLGIFGKSLSEWLSKQLAIKEINTLKIISEDFGWCISLDTKPGKLYVACSNIEASTNQWQVFVFADGSLLAKLF